MTRERKGRSSVGLLLRGVRSGSTFFFRADAAACPAKASGFLGRVTMSVRKFMVWMLLLCAMVVALPTCSSAQVNTVNLSGTVLDPQNLAVQDAKLTLQNPAKGIERTATSDANGRYEFVGLPPGTYTLAVDAPGFAIWTDTSFTLTLGQVAEYNPQLQLKTTAASVSVSAAPDLVETSKTDVSMTVTQNQIDNLPINGRNYINFTLLDSRAARDNTPSIGAAPNTGVPTKFPWTARTPWIVR